MGGLGRKMLAVVALASAVPFAEAAPDAAAANPDRIFFDGEIDDYVIGDDYITGSGSEVTASFAYGGAEGVQVSFRDAENWLDVLFISGDGAPLAVGRYENAVRAPFQGDGRPGLSVWGNGRGCNTVSGAFEITEITYGGAGDSVVLESFAAVWEHHCEAWDAASFGAVTYRASAPFRARTIGPKQLDLGRTPVGRVSPTARIEVRNDGPASLPVEAVRLAGDDADQFVIAADGCSGRSVVAGSVCVIDVQHRPLDTGATEHVAKLSVVDSIARSSAASGSTGQDVRLRAVPASPEGEFTPLAPARVLDTRDGTGAPRAPIVGGSSIGVPIAGRGGVPVDGAAAAVMNVTAIGATAPTFVTLWPSGQERPLASQLNPAIGGVSANMATVPLGPGGTISAYNHAGAVDLVFDVVGYFAAAGGPSGSRFVPVEPYRMFDTRIDAWLAPRGIGPGETLAIDTTVMNGHRLRDAGVTALVLNLTVTEPTADGYITAFPLDGPPPLASHVNFRRGQTVPNLVTVQVPANGSVGFFNGFGNAHLIADVVGYYTSLDVGTSGRFVPLTPRRAVDTRDLGRALGPDEYLWLRLAGFGGIPPSASAVAMNVTAIAPTAAGYLGVYPDDVCVFPFTSNVNFVAGETIPNSVVSRVSLPSGCGHGEGAIDIYNPFGFTHVAVDVSGYFTGSTT